MRTRVGRKFLYTVVAAAVVVAIAGTTFAVAGGDKKRLRAERLTGFHETPSVVTEGSGSFSLRIRNGGETIHYVLRYSDLEAAPAQAHIHLGQRGYPGGVAAFLCGGGDKPACPPEGVVRGVIEASDVVGPEAQGIAPGEIDELVRAIRKGYTYVNVHTSKFPAGEIRGQIADFNQRED